METPVNWWRHKDPLFDHFLRFSFFNVSKKKFVLLFRCVPDHWFPFACFFTSTKRYSPIRRQSTIVIKKWKPRSRFELFVNRTYTTSRKWFSKVRLPLRCPLIGLVDVVVCHALNDPGGGRLPVFSSQTQSIERHNDARRKEKWNSPTNG